MVMTRDQCKQLAGAVTSQECLLKRLAEYNYCTYTYPETPTCDNG